MILLLSEDKKELDNLLNQIKVNKYFWHTEERIFDVEFNFEDQCISMFSFPNCHYWHQPAEFWNNKLFSYNIFDKSVNLLLNAERRHYIIDVLKKKAINIYEINKNK